MSLTLEYLKEKAERLQKVTGCLLCIAGGAPRDILNDKPVNDIDVFLGIKWDSDAVEAVEVLTAELGMSLTKRATQDRQYINGSIVYEGTWEGHPWQFIFTMVYDTDSLTKFVENTIKGFDYGICQVAVVPYQTEPCTCTEEYIYETDNKQIDRNPNISPEQFRTEKAKARLKKLQEKYPEFTVTPLPEVNRNEERLMQRIREIQAMRNQPTTDMWIDELRPIPTTNSTNSTDSTDWMATTVTTRTT